MQLLNVLELLLPALTVLMGGYSLSAGETLKKTCAGRAGWSMQNMKVADRSVKLTTFTLTVV